MSETRVYWCCVWCLRDGVEAGAGAVEVEEACIAAHDDASPGCPAGEPITIPLRADDALDELLAVAIESAAVRETLARRRGEAR